MVEVEIYPVALSFPEYFMVLLVDKISKSRMPIIIDPYTANAIFRAVRGETHPRPLTHDLLKSFLVDDANIVVTKAVITDLKDEVYYALIHYDQGGEKKTKDSRPSDAIAVAALFSAPIFVEEELWLRVLDDDITKRNLADFDEMERREGVSGFDI